MIPISHVILHLGMCNAIARLAPQTQIALRVQVRDKIGDSQVNRVYQVTRGDESVLIVEFDSQRGIYSLQVNAPKYGCGVVDYLALLPDLHRSIHEDLRPVGDVPLPTPVLLDGTAPPSFLYAQPTFVVLDKSTAICNKPIGAQIPTPIRYENDQNGFYVWLPTNQLVSAIGSQQLAVRLRTATGEYHYIKIPLKYPTPWTGWPGSIEFNVTSNNIDGIATDPVDTLLCPRILITTINS